LLLLAIVAASLFLPAVVPAAKRSGVTSKSLTQIHLA
jgi:hypothetical protein